ncbi:hypothetical protein [Rhodococcus oxybenzonivorans]|uniref:hypothetical protein n=1 Tax=Rhodococcus oxybenzonivorans TaxID=1990687 RepID=UPI0013A59EAE|nr:hypothetical protein [Rhodococcus oxybenzonivorans]
MMSDNPEKYLTPAAKNALNAYLADVKDQVLNRALSQSQGGRDAREIGVSDLTEAIDDRERPQAVRASKRTLRLRQLAVLYVATGLLGLLTVLIFFSPEATFSGAQSIQTVILIASVITSFVGLVMSIAIYSASRRQERIPAHGKTGSPTPQDLEAFFLREWGLLESTLRRVIANQLGDSRAGNSALRELLDIAESNRILDEQSTADFNELLRLRNRIAHGRPSKGPELDVEDAIGRAKKLQRKLEAIDDKS